VIISFLSVNCSTFWFVKYYSHLTNRIEYLRQDKITQYAFNPQNYTCSTKHFTSKTNKHCLLKKNNAICSKLWLHHNGQFGFENFIKNKIKQAAKLYHK